MADDELQQTEDVLKKALLGVIRYSLSDVPSYVFRMLRTAWTVIRTIVATVWDIISGFFRTIYGMAPLAFRVARVLMLAFLLIALVFGPLIFFVARQVSEGLERHFASLGLSWTTVMLINSVTIVWTALAIGGASRGVSYIKLRRKKRREQATVPV